MAQDLVEYREYVRFLSQNNENRVFLNSDEEKAIVVFSELFAKAQKNVRIFAGCLSNSVSNSNDYISGISDFIARGGEVRILLNRYSKEKALESNLLKRLAFYQTEGKPVSIQTCNDKPYFSNDPDNKEVHFTVADGEIYRIETDIESRKSICNMNDQIMGEKLELFFDTLSQNATNLDLKSVYKMK
ncbi:hypothetical protein [uncultured Bacteroides sp.]|uniref:hypothetical protein n=1 Tax=uncultured Bacteroides sp. TaxID=162156 RepID=UPI00280A7503|nr:hypothetical protein [uncultured Bacteroides sp.]